jgi:hypothetical protein
MRRQVRLILIALASGAAALWVAFDAGVRVAPSDAKIPESRAAAAGSRDPSPAGPAAVVSALPARPALREIGADPFSPRAQQPPPEARTPPRGPVAPPLPFRFVGRVYQDTGTQVFLARAAKVYAIKKGDVLDGEYRVDAIRGTELAFTHLPSGSRQLMQFTPPIEEEMRVAAGAPGATGRAPPGPQPSGAPRPALLNWNDTLTLERPAHAASTRHE